MCIKIFDGESEIFPSLLQNPRERERESLMTILTYSIFFQSLKSRGFDLDFKLADDPNLSIQRYGQYLYGGLILFTTTTESKFLFKILTLIHFFRFIGFGRVFDIDVIWVIGVELQIL